ncbi:hypothetical protein CALCODRAFT_501110 [Calocera cornea HHB12733]|uniref:Chromo domain-containing protein n=1 Tax=Calocera cornea HHB12733 TaxID=1353952 RepID=A0A165DS53_9BASI|nr:hypothetical protein CALCODRAFT_501110 [Calocera cornea HHB12733]
MVNSTISTLSIHNNMQYEVDRIMEVRYIEGDPPEIEYKVLFKGYREEDNGGLWWIKQKDADGMLELIVDWWAKHRMEEKFKRVIQIHHWEAVLNSQGVQGARGAVRQ